MREHDSAAEHLRDAGEVNAESRRTPVQRQRGLGTRLANLLAPQDTEAPAEANPALRSLIPDSREPVGAGHTDENEAERPRLRQDESAFVGLEVLQRAFQLDLAALAYQRQGNPLQVHLRVSQALLRAPADAFSVSEAVERLFQKKMYGPRALAEGMGCLSLPTGQQDRSRGLYVLGRRGSPLTVRERLLAEVLCRTLGDSLHRSG